MCYGVQGCWLIRGQSIAPLLEANPDAEYYEWTKADTTDEKTKVCVHFASQTLVSSLTRPSLMMTGAHRGLLVLLRQHQRQGAAGLQGVQVITHLVFVRVMRVERTMARRVCFGQRHLVFFEDVSRRGQRLSTKYLKSNRKQKYLQPAARTRTFCPNHIFAPKGPTTLPPPFPFRPPAPFQPFAACKIT